MSVCSSETRINLYRCTWMTWKWLERSRKNAAQTQALAQLRKYIRGFLSDPTVPQLDGAGPQTCWKVGCMEDPTKTLLPEDKWLDELPQPQVWVESQKDWHEICPERNVEFSPSFKEQDVFYFQGKHLLNGLFGVERRTEVWTAASQSCS